MRRAILFCLTFILCVSAANEQIYFQSINLWDICLPKNAEGAVLLFKDGTMFALTENLENRVMLPWAYLFEWKKYRAEDLILVIHNHLGIDRWSVEDEVVYYRLKIAGFKGCFLLRLGNGAVIKWGD